MHYHSKSLAGEEQNVILHLYRTFLERDAHKENQIGSEKSVQKMVGRKVGVLSLCSRERREKLFD